MKGAFDSFAVTGSRHIVGRVGVALSDIKLAHSVFAAPFAILAAFLATEATRIGGEPEAGVWRRFGGQLLLVAGCLFFARTWAMLVNRLADRQFDAANPRTAGRALASGRLRAGEGMVVAALAAAGFVVCCFGFWALYGNPWPLFLSAPTLAWVAFYSFTKRFTLLCHVFLGSALAVSPVAAAIAVRPDALWHTPAIWLISGMVLLWVAGFDVAYALQDLEFDRETGLRSIPAAMGWRRALWTSRLAHAGAFGLLVGAAAVEPRFGAVFWVATAGVGALLAFEHWLLARRGLAGLPMAFYTLNGLVSLALGVAGSVDAVV